MPEGYVRAPLVRARPDSAIPLRTRIYVAAQFAVLLAFAGWVLIARPAHGFLDQAVYAAVIVAALLSLGGLLDGRKMARGFEIGRLALSGLFLIGLRLLPG